MDEAQTPEELIALIDELLTQAGLNREVTLTDDAGSTDTLVAHVKGVRVRTATVHAYAVDRSLAKRVALGLIKHRWKFLSAPVLLILEAYVQQSIPSNEDTLKLLRIALEQVRLLVAGH